MSLQKHPAPCCVLLNQYPQTEYPCPPSPPGTTEPFHQLHITQLMGRGAQTLIVPDTNTTAFLLCISILHISVSRSKLSYKNAKAGLIVHYIKFGACRLDSVNIPVNFNNPLKAVISHSLLSLSTLRCFSVVQNEKGKKKIKIERESSLNSKDEVPNRIFVVGSGAGCRKQG